MIKGPNNVGVAAATAVALVLLGQSVAAQDIEIRADGPNQSSSAAGADNVRMERNPGRQEANAGDGQGNQEIRRSPREDRGGQRDRSERGNRNSGEAAPASGFGAGTAAAPETAADGQAAVPAGGSETSPVRLPSTGGGTVPGLSAALVVAISAAAAGAAALRRRP
jgi:hypothetical protein